MNAQAITLVLKGRWQGHYGTCRCPVHADRLPSLKVKDDPRKADGIDVHCFAGCSWRDVKDALQRQGLLPDFDFPRLIAPALSELSRALLEPPKIDSEDDARKLKRALHIWKTASPLPGSLGERYFVEYRGLPIELLGDLSRALRWHKDIDAIVALMTDAATNEPRGIHRTFLNADGSKRERMMLGKQGVVRLSPDEEVTAGLAIAEGVEDALAITLSGWRPVWAATNAGVVERFPVLPGIEALTIFHDKDEAGTRAAELCAQRWASAGREAFL